MRTADDSAPAPTGLTRIHYRLEPRSIDSVTQYGGDLNDPQTEWRLVEYTRDSQGRVQAVGDRRGRSTHYVYDSRGNIIETRRKGEGLADIVTKSGYPDSCTAANQKICNKPVWTEDARGYRTVFNFSATHGGLPVRAMGDTRDRPIRASSP